MRTITASAATFAVLAFATDSIAQSVAQIDYMLECQGCHLPDGSGSSQGSVPSLLDSVGRFVMVPAGRSYLVRVPGSAQSPLDDARLAAVLNWMIRNFGPAQVAASFEPFTATEVARHRSEPLTHVARVRSELLRQLEESPQTPASARSGHPNRLHSGRMEKPQFSSVRQDP